MILLRNGDVYAPEPLGTADLLLAGGRIAAMGALGDPPAAWRVTEIDATGLKVVPGLIDAHTHLGGGGGEGGAHTRVPALQVSELTRHGVTTAIGLLGTDTVTRSMEDLLAAARGLETLGLTALCYTGGYAVPPCTLTGSVRGDLVHVDRIVAVGETAISDHRSSQPTFDELARLASDCHVAGVLTGKAGLLHLHLGDGSRGLALVRQILDTTELPARVLHPTHCNRNPALWAEALELGARGGYVDVTAFPLDPSEPDVPSHEALLAWDASGNPWDRVTLTSDGGGCLPTFDEEGVLTSMDVGSCRTLLETVRALVAADMPLGKALEPVTSTVAKLFRLGSKGRLALGADADVLLLDAELAVHSVFAKGRKMLVDGQLLTRGPFET